MPGSAGGPVGTGGRTGGLVGGLTTGAGSGLGRGLRPGPLPGRGLGLNGLGLLGFGGGLVTMKESNCLLNKASNIATL